MDMNITVTKPVLPKLTKYIEYLEKIWSTRWLTNEGEFVKLLENELLKFLGLSDLSLVSNGTLALHIALKALNASGEVITTPFTFPATTNVIIWEGLTPVFADIDFETFNIDPNDVERKITKKTSAILAVHTYGNPCYVEELKEIADKHAIKLIYDAAHAFGVDYKHRSVASYGDVSTLSFHATKVFNTIEGGAICCRDKDISEKVKLLRNHGIKSEGEFLLAGTNAKMNEFQAAMGLCNLEKLNDEIRIRSEIFNHYQDALCESRGVSFQKLVASKYNYAYMPVCFESARKRNEVYLALLRNGIGSRKYFYPLTCDPQYVEKHLDLVKKYNLKNASNVSDRILCLPLYPDLQLSLVDEVIRIVKGQLAS